MRRSTTSADNTLSTVVYQVLNKQVPVPVLVPVVQVPVQAPVPNLQEPVPVPVINLQVPVPVQVLCINYRHSVTLQSHKVKVMVSFSAVVGPNFSTRTRPDSVRDPCLRPGLLYKVRLDPVLESPSLGLGLGLGTWDHGDSVFVTHEA